MAAFEFFKLYFSKYIIFLLIFYLILVPRLVSKNTQQSVVVRFANLFGMLLNLGELGSLAPIEVVMLLEAKIMKRRRSI